MIDPRQIPDQGLFQAIFPSLRVFCKTDRNIFSVSLPVCVFRGLGWYEQTIAGIPSPNFSTLPWQNAGDGFGRTYLSRIILITVLKANCPRQRIAFKSFSESISLARYSEQLDVSSMVGLLSGGAHLTAAVTNAPFNVRPSPVLFDVGWFAKPVLCKAL